MELGEVAVAFDKYMRRGIIDDSREVFKKFLGEIRLLVKIGQAAIVPIDNKTIIKAIKYIFKYGIYIADAV